MCKYPCFEAFSETLLIASELNRSKSNSSDSELSSYTGLPLNITCHDTEYATGGGGGGGGGATAAAGGVGGGGGAVAAAAAGAICFSCCNRRCTGAVFLLLLLIVARLRGTAIAAGRETLGYTSSLGSC